MVLYFNADSVDAADPTAFCKAKHCPRLTEKQGRHQGVFTCTGPQPFNGDQFLATIPFDRTALSHTDASRDDKLRPFSMACGVNTDMFFDARVARGG